MLGCLLSEHPPIFLAWIELEINTKWNHNHIFLLYDYAFVLAPGVLKADGTQGPLVSLGNSSSEQASTSKQYGALGPRDDVFSLGGPSYMTASKNCGSRTLGCDLETLQTQDKCSHWATADICVTQTPTEKLSCLITLPFLLTAGQPCWTVNLKAQGTPSSPCWREPLHSQMKVSSPSAALSN